MKHYPSENHVYALHQADWLSNQLLNRWGFSDENNCLKLGYDPVNRFWPDALGKLGFPLSLLPRVVPAGRAITTINSYIANQLGLPQSVQLVSGTTDSIAAFIASGANRVGEAVTSLGSTLVIKLISDRPLYAPEFGVYSHRLGDLWLVGGASNSGGKVLRHYFSQQQLDDMTSQLKPNHLTGLDYYPLTKQGERFPFADVNKLPVLTPRPDSDVVFFQGILEGIANIEKLGYQRLAELGAPVLISVRSVGGGSNNAQWTQVREKTLKVKMIPSQQLEASYGSALLAMQSNR